MSDNIDPRQTRDPEQEFRGSSSDYLNLGPSIVLLTIVLICLYLFGSDPRDNTRVGQYVEQPITSFHGARETSTITRPQ